MELGKNELKLIEAMVKSDNHTVMWIEDDKTYIANEHICFVVNRKFGLENGNVFMGLYILEHNLKKLKPENSQNIPRSYIDHWKKLFGVNKTEKFPKVLTNALIPEVESIKLYDLATHCFGGIGLFEDIVPLGLAQDNVVHCKSQHRDGIDGIFEFFIKVIEIA